jgi:hypothetical protein
MTKQIGLSRRGAGLFFSAFVWVDVPPDHMKPMKKLGNVYLLTSIALLAHVVPELVSIFALMQKGRDKKS